MSIAIIGAGPAGATAAKHLAKHDDVTIYEEHPQVGKPVACTGILTDSLNNYLTLKKKYILNKIRRFEVYGTKEKTEFTVKGENVIVDRHLFDQALIEDAIKQGAKLETNHRLKDVKLNKKIHLNFANNTKEEVDILIGADGPVSTVAKQIGLFKKRDFIVGMQVLANGDFNKHVIEVHMTKSPGLFAWVVPVNEEVARVGVATAHKTSDWLKTFLAFLKTKDYTYCKGDDESGVIPLYNRHVQTQKENRVFLVGDAATQTKNTTAGGIVPGIICGNILADSIKNKTDYQKTWRKKIGKDLYYHYLIRKAIDTFKPKDYDKLVQLLQKEKPKSLIETFDREFPSKFMMKMLLHEPKLLGMVKHLRL
ncbi:hypothetical protein CL622_04060 [archaeon]|nr:hypothetical protein [archaeon]|tara:strand:- start:581 stop:1678 length:1098 start_codon:yes stop_codon:yes gene_type:complete